MMWTFKRYSSDGDLNTVNEHYEADKFSVTGSLMILEKTKQELMQYLQQDFCVSHILSFWNIYKSIRALIKIW